MDGPIALEIFEDGGVFRHGEDYDEIAAELDGALDRRDAGHLTPSRYLATLKSIVARHPHFIDGHAHLGYALLEQGKPKLALQACLRGFAAGESAIPSGFYGTIEWGFLENRPFLRAAHGVVLCQLRIGRRREALPLMERMLAWNPGDNQGVRYAIGSEYLRADRMDEARRFFDAEAAHYPPYHYELGLLHLREKEPVAAATSLRLGFVANGYIAEMLCGNLDPMPFAIWHGSNFAEPELARGYLERCGDLWRRTQGGVAFLRWLHTHPKVLAERAAVFAVKEALLWEHDPRKRSGLADQEEAAIQRIDARLSEEIVTDRADRHGRLVSPWLYPEGRSRRYPARP